MLCVATSFVIRLCRQEMGVSVCSPHNLILPIHHLNYSVLFPYRKCHRHQVRAKHKRLCGKVVGSIYIIPVCRRYTTVSREDCSSFHYLLLMDICIETMCYIKTCYILANNCTVCKTCTCSMSEHYS